MSLLKHAPRFNARDAVRIAQEIYGVRAMAAALPSERDQNFLLQTESGDHFVLKIANATEDRELLEAQQQAMARVAQDAPICQRVVESLGGASIAEIESPAGVRHFVWLVTYQPGVPLGGVKRHSPELLFDLGRRVGQLDRALADFDHPAVHRDFHWDLA
ncbi:MAG: phosphotransferase, partial [Blastocatellia bacterium]